jgi:gluconate 5-dehydrogenase
MTGTGLATFDFSGQTVFVTGSTRGIGRKIAESFVNAGARIILHGRSETSANAAAIEVRRAYPEAEVHAVAFDISDTDTSQATIADLDTRFDGLDVLISNAGFQNRTPIDDLSVETYRDVVEGNLVSHFATCKAAAAGMAARGNGSIVVIASILAQHGRPGLAGYCSSKSGLLGLIRVMACEYASRGVRTNAVGPGFIATDMTADMAAIEEFSERVIQRTPAARWGAAEDICGAAMFLSSDAADFVHGQILYVDGGLTAAF